jgi:hypothetical protein
MLSKNSVTKNIPRNSPMQTLTSFTAQILALVDDGHFVIADSLMTVLPFFPSILYITL